MIPAKDYVYGAVIVALLAAFGAYTVHERHEGAAHIAAADAKAATAEAAKNQAITDAAQAASNQVIQTYEKAVAIPPVADLGLMCKSPGSRELPQAPGDSGRADAAAARTDGPSYDPSGAALTIGRDADAKIVALQDEIHALVSAMNGGH